MPWTLRRAIRGRIVSQSTVITNHSGRDQATDAETTRKRERGLHGATLYVTQTGPQVTQPGEFHRAADTIRSRGHHIKRTSNKQLEGNGGKLLQGSGIEGCSGGWVDRCTSSSTKQVSCSAASRRGEASESSQEGSRRQVPAGRTRRKSTLCTRDETQLWTPNVEVMGQGRRH